MRKLSLVAAATILLFACCEATRGQGPSVSSIESLGHLRPSYRRSSGRRVSDDGSVVVGWSNGPVGRPYGFRWSVDGGLQELAPNPQDDESDAFGVSGDGSVVAGLTYGASRNATPARWKQDGTLEEPYAPTTFDRGVAYGVSGDGVSAVGYGATMYRLPSHAFRYDAASEPYDLGTINGYSGISVALDASYHADVIVGWSESDQLRKWAFRWTEATGVEQLGALGSSSSANSVTDDGETIVGTVDPGAANESAFIWTAAGGMRILPKIDGPGGKSSAHDISRDGVFIVGRCRTIQERLSARGEACVWRNGVARSLWDLLENEYPADLEGWSELLTVEGISADGRTLTGQGLYRGDLTAFRVVLVNSAPTLSPIAPVTAECEGGVHVAKLEALVGDDGRRVTVRWKVDGVTIQSQEDVSPGVTAFEYAFPHGESTVVVEATDGEFTTRTATTVTVSDTTAPTLSVASDVIVPADPRRNFATHVALPSPEIYDVCDGDPELIHDAPARFPMGQTVVRWTAIDADGNQATANQRVVVEDREAPTLSSMPDLEVRCDWGRVFATLRLPPPDAVDNVTDKVVVKSDATSRFRVGRTRVTWTATDQAGNSAKKSMIVNVVNRTPRARPGKTVKVEASSERGVRLRLDGSASSDPDGHTLRYSWRAPGVVFANPRSSKPTALFPVGTTLARLTVTDQVGAERSATVRVVVKLANSEERPRGAQANRAFERAAISAQRGAESGAASEARLAGLAHAASAQLLGAQAGERIRWEADGSTNQAKIEYAALRDAQRRQGLNATRAWLHAYAEAGDDATLAAAMDSLRGVVEADADLSQR